MQPLNILGYNQQGGLQTDVKPFLLANQAFARLENAYAWRNRVRKRDGLRLLGRLRRTFAAASIGNSGASPWTINTLYSNYVPAITPEANAQIEAGSVIITIAAGPNIVFTDQGDGTLTSPTGGNSGTINYLTGIVVLTHTAGAGVATTASFNYFPSLPVMGIWQREIANKNAEETIIWDTRYAYKFSGTGFQEVAAGTTWDGTDADFFWATNFRGTNPYDRLMFVTNFVDSATVPMRYTDGTTWTAFTPRVVSTGATLLLQALILIPYYGRMIALNTREGAVLGTSNNFFNRCRFSQIGNPIAVDAWDTDVFGKGGFIDAPINEQIVSATFIKNTLLVQFERSTWQLRYVGEYGLPFLWERVSSDFGAESTFASVLFDDGVLAVGDRAIVAANANTVQRIDENIPDLVFDIHNGDNGPERVWGIRDFQKEVVYWCYPDAQFNRKFPNRVLVYNYSNQTFAIFRDNVTAFGIFQPTGDINWNSTEITWDDQTVTWDDVEAQSDFPNIISGNQQGFVHFYGYNSAIAPSVDDTKTQESLQITAIDTTVSPNTITVVNHNLENTVTSVVPGDGTVIYIRNTLWSGTDPGLNDRIFVVQREDDDTLSLFEWDATAELWTPTDIASPAAGTYIGNGTVTYIPRMYIQTKDFNPYLQNGMNLKFIQADFLLDFVPDGLVSVITFVNTSESVTGNLPTGQESVESDLPTPYYLPLSDIAWHRFYGTVAGQFVRVVLTYNNELMADVDIHEQKFVLNAMTIYTRPGSKVVF